jgi:hypothetical protein
MTTKITTDNIASTSLQTLAVIVKDEGSNLTTSVASIDFVGSGVTATNTGNAVTVTVSGSGSGSGTTRAQAMTMGIIFGG